MNTKQVTETFTQVDGNNRVLRTSNTFVEGSVVVKDVLTGNIIPTKEMSTELIKLLDPVAIDTKLMIIYNVQVSVYNTELDLIRELRKLQERVSLLEEQNELLLEAMQERVPLKTFKQWISLMEKNFGKAVLDENSLMGIQGAELP